MQRIGFIGLGIMGNPMARRLINAGYSLTVMDLQPALVDALVNAGVRAAGTPLQVAEQSNVVISIVSDSQAVDQIVFGANGLLAGFSPGMMYIDMSTIAPATWLKVYQALEAKGVAALDAPVSGGYMGAESGTLSIMVGGDGATFQRALPIFKALGKNILHMGAAGAGQITKACNQIVIGVTLHAVTEALTLAKKANINPARVRQALLGGFAMSRVLEHQGERIVERNFKPGFKLKLHRKDLHIALETGKEYGVPLPSTAVAAQQMDTALALGGGESDHTIIAAALDKMAGMTT